MPERSSASSSWDEQRPAPALVVSRDWHELEDPFGVRAEAGLLEALVGTGPDEVLCARARVDPGRLDSDDAA
jgi:hypothetical protein